MFSETWISKNIIFPKLGLNNYNIYKYDLIVYTCSLSRGGDSLIAVSYEFDLKLLNTSMCALETIYFVLKKV